MSVCQDARSRSGRPSAATGAHADARFDAGSQRACRGGAPRRNAHIIEEVVLYLQSGHGPERAACRYMQLIDPTRLTETIEAFELSPAAAVVNAVVAAASVLQHPSGRKRARARLSSAGGLPVCLSVRLYVWWFVWPFLHRSFYLSACLSVGLSVRPSVCLSVRTRARAPSTKQRST